MPVVGGADMPQGGYRCDSEGVFLIFQQVAADYIWSCVQAACSLPSRLNPALLRGVACTLRHNGIL